MIEIAAYTLIFASSIILASKFGKGLQYAVAALAVLAGAIPAIVRLSIPTSMMDQIAQLSLWPPALAAIIASGLTLILLCVIAIARRFGSRPLLAVVGLVVAASFLLPVHRDHPGWSQHGHFIWESPYHVH